MTIHICANLAPFSERLRIKRVTEAEDGAMGYQVFKQTNPDVIIVDWMMERVNGTDFTLMVRTSDDSPNRFVPIIMVTGHSEKQRVQLGQRRDRIHRQTGVRARPLRTDCFHHRNAASFRPGHCTSARTAGEDRAGSRARTGERTDDRKPLERRATKRLYALPTERNPKRTPTKTKPREIVLAGHNTKALSRYTTAAMLET